MNRKKPVPHVHDVVAPGGQVGFQLATERIARELAINARNALVAAAAHDLRSPLNGIQGWAHVLESRVGSESPLVRRALAGIQNGVEQQAQLIGDVTDMLHVMNGTMTLHPEVVSLHGVIEAVLNGMREAAGSRKLEFMLNGEDVAVWADPGRLTQAIERVLAHVVRTAMEGEQIGIEASAGPLDVSLRISGKSGLISPVTTAAPKRLVKIPAGLLLAYRLVELNRGRMQHSALDGDGAREGYVITLMRADAKAAWHENDSQADIAHRSLVAACAQVSLHPVRIALVPGPGSNTLQHALHSLGAQVDVVATDGTAVTLDSHDLIMLPADTGEITGHAAVTLPRIMYGQDPKASSDASGVLGSVQVQQEPLQLAAVVMAAAKVDPASMRAPMY